MLRLILAASLALLVAYTMHCTRRENFWHSARTILQLRWGRQVTADLYIGLMLSLLFICRQEGPAAALAWTPATLALGQHHRADLPGDAF